MPTQLQRLNAPLTAHMRAQLLPFIGNNHDALDNATATWVVRKDDAIVSVVTIRTQLLTQRRCVICRFTTPIGNSPDARALRAAVARVFETDVAKAHTGYVCHWAETAHPHTRMSPRARTAANDAIALLSAHLAWAGQKSTHLRRVS